MGCGDRAPLGPSHRTAGYWQRAPLHPQWQHSMAATPTPAPSKNAPNKGRASMISAGRIGFEFRPTAHSPIFAIGLLNRGSGGGIACGALLRISPRSPALAELRLAGLRRRPALPGSVLSHEGRTPPPR